MKVLLILFNMYYCNTHILYTCRVSSSNVVRLTFIGSPVYIVKSNLCGTTSPLALQSPKDATANFMAFRIWLHSTATLSLLRRRRPALLSFCVILFIFSLCRLLCYSDLFSILLWTSRREIKYHWIIYYY